MKNVFLIGDSIRIGAKNSPGYGVFVKENLKDEANVYGPDDNCRFAQYTLRGIYDWKRQVDAAAIDVVHWNNGLWDLLHIDGDEALTPLDTYLSFLERIYKSLCRAFPNAKIIFALTTAVVERKAGANFYRRNAEIEVYNAAARELMNRLGVEVNDLYEVSGAFGEEMYADAVHFADAGSRLLAERVTAKIREQLK